MRRTLIMVSAASSTSSRLPKARSSLRALAMAWWRPPVEAAIRMYVPSASRVPIARYGSSLSEMSRGVPSAASAAGSLKRAASARWSAVGAKPHDGEHLAPGVDRREHLVRVRRGGVLLGHQMVADAGQGAQHVELLHGELRTAQRVTGLVQLGVDLGEQIVPHAHQADGGGHDDAERQQREVGQGQLGAQGVGPALAVRQPDVHASPYPTPRRVVITGGPRVSSLRRR